MGDRQKILGHAGIALRRDRQMPITAIGQRCVAAPAVGHDHDPGLNRRLDKPAERSCRTIRHDFHPNTAGVPAVAARHAFEVLGLALADFDSRDNEALIMDAAALAARPAADPGLVDLDMIPRMATDAVAIGSDHAGAELWRIWNAVS